MTIAIIALAIGFAGVAVYAHSLERKIESIYSRLAKTANNEAGFRADLKKEMTKLHVYCEENHARIKELDKRVEDYNGATLKAVASLGKKQKEFEDLADESVRAQIESEKAWAEGVRAIAGFGADIPTLNTKGLNNERR